jgi:hypothetical protein
MASYDGSNFAGCIAGFLLSDIRVLTEIREVWEVLPLLAAFARQKKTLRCPERPLFPSYAFDRAPAAKVCNPPFVSKSAWRSNLTDSLSHNYRERPKADIQRLIAMLRSQPALPPFGANATSEIWRSTTLD